MGAVRSLAVLTAGAAIGAAAVIAHRIMQETGKPLQEAVAEVPAEIEKLYAELKAKALDVIDTARTANEGTEQDPADNFSESSTGQQ